MRVFPLTVSISVEGIVFCSRVNVTDMAIDPPCVVENSLILLAVSSTASSPSGEVCTIA